MDNHITAPSRNYANWALGLAYFTIWYNVLEAIVAIFFGAKASSLALVSFGLDSTVEVLSALAIVWHLRGAMTKHREQRALKLIAISFFILAVYVCIQSLFDIFGNRQPETSIPGLVIGIASLIIMPFLAIAKRRIGKLMSSVTVKSDAQQHDTWMVVGRPDCSDRNCYTRISRRNPSLAILIQTRRFLFLKNLGMISLFWCRSESMICCGV